MLNLIDKNLLIAACEKALDYVHLRADITSLSEVETALVDLRAAFDADPDAVTADQIEAVLLLMENAKFPSLKYIEWAFPFWFPPSAPRESLLTWLSTHLLWELITGKPSTFPPDAHTHAQYLESVAWSLITGKPSTFPPDAHTHAQYLESVAWSDVTGKPATYPPDAHTHAQYLESVAWSLITGKPSTYPPETHTHPEYEGGGTTDGRLKMWLGTGATSSAPHVVFDTALNPAAYMLLRFPFSTYRFTVWGPKPNDSVNCYYYDTGIGTGSSPYSDRLSASGLGVFGAWDSVNSFYVCFSLVS